MSKEVKEVCYAAYRSSINETKQFDIAPEVLSLLGEAGFKCNHAWILEKVLTRRSWFDTMETVVCVCRYRCNYRVPRCQHL